MLFKNLAYVDSYGKKQEKSCFFINDDIFYMKNKKCYLTKYIAFTYIHTYIHNFILKLFYRDIDLRSEEHTSELQSRGHLVCRLLLEKKKTLDQTTPIA